MDTTGTQEKATSGAEKGRGASATPEAHPEPTAEELRVQREQAEEAEATVGAVRAAAELGGGKAKGELSPKAAKSALDWFLSDEEPPRTRTIDLNLGTPDMPRRFAWTITAIGSETLKRIREQGISREGRRQQARGEVPQVDNHQINARIVLAGTVEPDLREAAKRKLEAAGETMPPDPDIPALQLLQHRLRHKPGLIDQLSASVLELSGYDDDDIREHEAGKA